MDWPLNTHIKTQLTCNDKFVSGGHFRAQRSGNSLDTLVDFKTKLTVTLHQTVPLLLRETFVCTRHTCPFRLNMHLMNRQDFSFLVNWRSRSYVSRVTSLWRRSVYRSQDLLPRRSLGVASTETHLSETREEPGIPNNISNFQSSMVDRDAESLNY